MSYEKTVEELRSNPEQWRAFQAAGHCVTLAGPGSGKTKVLTMKMARLLRETVRAPRGVACVTYNNECARELERRLTSIGAAGLTNAFVGTLHRFCLRHILGPLAKVADLDVPQPIAIAPEAVQVKTLEQAMKNIGISVQGFKTDMDRFRRTSIDRIDGQDGWQIGDEGLTDVTLEYERLLRSNGLLDFQDIILMSLRALETSETVRRCMAARFPVLLVDEYQDLGVPLHRMVLSLAFRAGVRIFAVGDPDQSIYGFTGARPDLLRELAARKDVETVQLRVNYRSGRRIVAAAALALGEQRNYQAKRAEDGNVAFIHCEGGLGDQVTHLATHIIPALLKKGDAYGDIAILYPTHQEGDAIEAGLATAQVPFARLDQGGGYRRTLLIRLIEECAAWCCGGWEQGTPSLAGIMQRWRSVLDAVDDAQARTARKALVRFLFSNRDPEGSVATWLQLFNKEVFRPHVLLPEAADADECSAFEELLAATMGKGPLSTLDMGMFAGKASSTQRVSLMNLHTSKGTEFNAVLLVGMDAGRMPLYRAKTPAELAEQRRLFFVGVSRAIREVHLLYSGWTESPSGYRFANGPSPFLLELQKGLGRLGKTKGASG